MFLSSQLGPGPAGAAACQLVTQPWVTIGDVNNPVNDGDSQGGVVVSTTCSVTAAANGFSVSANAVLLGSVTISGIFTNDRTVQQKITAHFQKDFGTFDETDCTVDYSANPLMGVAAGRVWGTLTCPSMQFPSQGRTCQGTAEFKFERCNQ